MLAMNPVVNQFPLHQLAKEVFDGEVGFLDVLGVVTGDADGNVRKFFEWLAPSVCTSCYESTVSGRDVCRWSEGAVRPRMQPLGKSSDWEPPSRFLGVKKEI